MKDIKLTKVKRIEVVILQSEIQHYADVQRLERNWSTEDFMDALVAVDVALRLWFIFRNKIELDNEKISIRLKVSEAAILFKCCFWQRKERDGYEKVVCDKYKNILDQQLISFRKITQ